MDFRLSSKKPEFEGFMTEPEFTNTMEDFFYINDARQIEISYKKSLAHSYWDGFEYFVPINKLSHIAAYFCLIQIVSELKENINKLIADSRAKNLERELHGNKHSRLVWVITCQNLF